MSKMQLKALAIVTFTAFTAANAWAAPLPALYTAAQASAGADVYTQSCAMCHGDKLQGQAGPALIGQAFAAAGKAATVGSVFSTVAGQMPMSAPGSLTKPQYEDVMAYILQKNGYPAGGKTLDYAPSLSSSQAFVSQVP